MSKQSKKRKLAVFIGLRTAHQILLDKTKKPDSVPRLMHEVDLYSDLIFSLTKGNWNKDDVTDIQNRAKKRCINKLNTYPDLKVSVDQEIEQTIHSIMIDIGLIK